MTGPNWLDERRVLILHTRLLTRFGGLEGIRDHGLLDSALNRPLHLFHYGSPDLFDLAAAYAEGIFKNHPFLDGNKRTGFMSAYTFLGLNGLSLQAPEEEAVVMTVSLADGRLGAEGFARWLKDSCPVS